MDNKPLVQVPYLLLRHVRTSLLVLKNSWEEADRKLPLTTGQRENYEYNTYILNEVERILVVYEAVNMRPQPQETEPLEGDVIQQWER